MNIDKIVPYVRKVDIGSSTHPGTGPDEYIRLSTAWQYDPPPELLERDRLPQNEVGLLLS